MTNRTAGSRPIPALVVLALTLGCSARPQTVDIHATNYAFRAPASVRPGMTAFRFINDGSVLHEVQLFRFRSGITADSAAILLGAGPIPESAYDISGSVLITAPGHTAHEMVLVPLSQGEVYGLLCEFQDADSLPRHSTMGMWAVIRID